jgi:hypothetical protein
MAEPSATVPLGPVLVIARSVVAVLTVALAVALLLAGFVSVVLVAAVAVLLIVVPVGTPAFALTTMVNVAEALAAKEATVKEIVPVPPAGGVVAVNVGPEVCVSDTKVVFAGTASVKDTVWASLGPLLVRVTV